MNNNNTLALALLGFGGFIIYQQFSKNNNQNQGYSPYPTTPNVPMQPNPITNASAWQSWVSAIIGVFGTAVELWQPGGPFYNSGISQQEAENIYLTNGGQYDSDSPFNP